MQPRTNKVYDFGAFLDPPSALFRDYLHRRGGAAAFFAGGGWDLEGVVRAAQLTAARERPRAALASALVRQQQARGAGQAARAAELLAQPECVAVVSGQQAVLFGGPLYVLYKALAACRLARELAARRGAPVVPVFWIASDDHDFAEVRALTLLDEAGQLRTLRYQPQHEPSGQPASRIVLDDSITRLLDELAVLLPPSPQRTELVERLRAAYRPGHGLAEAFARLLSGLLPEMVVLDPSDAELKALMRPLLRRELAEGSPSSRLAAAAGEALRAAGYHQQVPVRPGFFNLFAYLDGERRALATADGGVELRGSGRRLALDEILGLLDEQPERFSPGALLRPLVQDLLLPTAAYVGGPAEIAYHAQIGPCYAAWDVPRPVLVPRPSLTLLEPAQARVLEAEALSLPELQADPEGRVAQWTREAHPQVEAAFAAALGAVHRELSHVEEVLGAFDPTLRAAAGAARGRALHPIETLQEKALRALKKRDQTRAERLRRTRDTLMPGGLLQERGLGFVGFLARHGLGLLVELEAQIDVWSNGHRLLALGAPRPPAGSPAEAAEEAL